MELIDDWAKRQQAPQAKEYQVPVPRPLSAKAIGASFAGFKPDILNLHCYEDVGYPWVQVMFGEVIHPSVALRVGEKLAELAGGDFVYLNSLRPNAVYFVLEPAFGSKPDLDASRYGARLVDIEKAWQPSHKGTGSRGA